MLKCSRKNSFELTNLDAELEEEDEESRRLREDAMLDQFKLIEKFLMYWLPEIGKKLSQASGGT